MEFFDKRKRILSGKTGLIKSLIDRTRKINNTDSGFNNDVNDLIFTLKRNLFPQHLIDNVIEGHNQNTNSSTSFQPLITEPTTDKPTIRYFKLPFIGYYSELTNRRLKSLIKRFCIDLEVKLVFSSYKIKNLFSFKDPIPSELQSCVVYQFTCAGCNSRYIGETSRHLSTRIKEHISSDKKSHIFKHFKTSPNCKSLYSPSCFEIIDSSNLSTTLKLKEALHINKVKPELNKQLFHFNTIFSL